MYWWDDDILNISGVMFNSVENVVVSFGFSLDFGGL